MSLHNRSNDHTAVLSSVWSACQRQVRGWASFPAQREFRRLLLQQQSGARSSGGRGWGPARRPRGHAPSAMLPALLCLFIYACTFFLPTFQLSIYFLLD